MLRLLRLAKNYKSGNCEVLQPEEAHDYTVYKFNNLARDISAIDEHLLMFYVYNQAAQKLLSPRFRSKVCHCHWIQRLRSTEREK